jgi:hypothetical protein
MEDDRRGFITQKSCDYDPTCLEYCRLIFSIGNLLDPCLQGHDRGHPCWVASSPGGRLHTQPTRQGDFREMLRETGAVGLLLAADC